MALTPATFFTSLSDVNLAKDVVAKQPDLYIQRYEFIGKGVLTIAATNGTLAPAVSPAFTADLLISTVANNLLIVDNDGEVCEGKVSDNDANGVTFVVADMKKVKDGSACDLTTALTYDFYVLTPSSIAGMANGPYFGYTEGAELAISEEWMKFKYGQPAKMMFKDLKERAIAINGGTVNFDNEDILKAVLNVSEFGVQTSQFSYGVGSDPVTDQFYRLTFIGADRNGRAIKIQIHKVQINLNGNMFQKSEAGYYMLSFAADVIADNFYPDTADMMLVTRAD